MNRKTFFSFAAGILVILACSHETDNQSQTAVPRYPMTFTAIADGMDADTPSTRTYIDGTSIQWTEDDEISVIDPAGANNPFTVAAISGREATFTGSVTATGPAYLAIYPYDAENTGSLTDDTVTATLPSEQVITTRNVAPGALLCVAKSTETETFDFRNVFGYVDLTITAEDIASVSFVGNGGEPLAGKVTVAVGTEPVATPVPGETCSSVTIRPETGALAPGKYYFAVLPGELPSGFRVIFTKTNGLVGVKSWSGSQTIERSGGITLGSSFPTKWHYPIEARFVASTSSTLTFEWTENSYNNPSADLARNYRFGLYRDAGCTDLVVSWNTPKTNIYTGPGGVDINVFSGATPRFLFSGLASGTDYWFQVSDEGYKSVSEPVKATTVAFTPVVPGNPVANGDVLLAEDFSELIWGGDLVGNAAGYSHEKRSNAGTPLAPASGDNPHYTENGTYLCEAAVEMELFSTLYSRLTSSRLASWGAVHETSGDRNLILARPGYVKLGKVFSSGGYGLIVTPALSGIPAGKTANVKVTFKAARYGNDPRFGKVSVLSGGTMGEKHRITGADEAKIYTFEVPSDGSWHEFTFAFFGVDNASRLAFGIDRDLAGSGKTARMYIDDISVRMTSNYDALPTPSKPSVTIVTDAAGMGDYAELTFPAVSGATEYIVYANGVKVPKMQQTTSGGTVTIIVGGLEKGPVTFQVKARSKDGDTLTGSSLLSPTSDQKTVVNNRLSLYEAHPTDAVIEWTPVSNASGKTYSVLFADDTGEKFRSDAMSLKLAKSSVYTGTSILSSTVRLNLSGLQPATRYAVFVKEDAASVQHYVGLRFTTAAAHSPVDGEVLFQGFDDCLYSGDFATGAYAVGRTSGTVSWPVVTKNAYNNANVTIVGVGSTDNTSNMLNAAVSSGNSSLHGYVFTAAEMHPGYVKLGSGNAVGSMTTSALGTAFLSASEPAPCRVSFKVMPRSDTNPSSAKVNLLVVHADGTETVVFTDASVLTGNDSYNYVWKTLQADNVSLCATDKLKIVANTAAASSAMRFALDDLQVVKTGSFSGGSTHDGLSEIGNNPYFN